MRRTLKKRILPLLCAGLLLCTPHTIAYATAGGTDSTMPPAVETTPPPAKETAPPVETTPQPVATPTQTPTPQPVATQTPTPQPVATPTQTPTPAATPTPTPTPKPPEKRPAAEPTAPPSYSVEIAPVKLDFDCAPVWNTETHRYEGWKSSESPITVTNNTPGGAAVQVTLTFTASAGTGITAAFAPPVGDPKPEDFTISNGTVTFKLPRTGSKDINATINLSLSCSDAKGLNTPQYNQIGSIKMEMTPLQTPVTRPAAKPTGPAQAPPTASSHPEPLPAEPKPLPAVPGRPLPVQPEQLPPPVAEGQPSEPEQPKQESKPGAMPPPEQNSNEETQTAPRIEPGGSPQEEPQ